ncbi:Hypothetical protein D9617_49g041310 [Elsinoe fawcettii]|nr:Hypothetical protein D9617_49g041310 [Elsinoe fawcettii]
MIPAQQYTPPPAHDRNLPPTPPGTNEAKKTVVHSVIHDLSQRRAGCRNSSVGAVSEESFEAYALSWQEYLTLEKELLLGGLQGFVSDKLRLEYNADLELLNIRMPTQTHELLVERIEDSIKSQLKSIASRQDEQASFARKIIAARSSQVLLPQEDADSDDEISENTKSNQPIKYSKYEPDASFRHKDARYPGVIVEVAVAQKGKSLERLAENYLLDSDGSVQAVVGLNVERDEMGRLEGFLSVWRTKMIKANGSYEMRVDDQHTNMPLRNELNQGANSSGLRLSLRDFTYPRQAQKELPTNTTDIVLSREELCRILKEAETNVASNASGKNELPPNVRKRKKSKTPPDDIRTSDEEEYYRREKRSAMRDRRNDPDYVGD